MFKGKAKNHAASATNIVAESVNTLSKVESPAFVLSLWASAEQPSEIVDAKLAGATAAQFKIILIGDKIRSINPNKTEIGPKETEPNEKAIGKRETDLQTGIKVAVNAVPRLVLEMAKPAFVRSLDRVELSAFIPMVANSAAVTVAFLMTVVLPIAVGAEIGDLVLWITPAMKQIKLSITSTVLQSAE